MMNKKERLGSFFISDCHYEPTRFLRFAQNDSGRDNLVRNKNNTFKKAIVKNCVIFLLFRGLNLLLEINNML